MHLEFPVEIVPLAKHSILSHITFHFQTYNMDNTYKSEITFGIKEKHQTPSSLDKVMEITERYTLSDDGVELVIFNLPYFSDLVLQGKALSGDRCASHFKFRPKTKNYRNALNSLFNKGFFNTKQLATMQDPLSKIEKMLEYQSVTSDKINESQEKFLNSILEMNIEPFKGEKLLDTDTFMRILKKICADIVTLGKGWCDIDTLYLTINTAWCDSLNDKQRKYIKENIWNFTILARICAGVSNLESVFLELGSNLPSNNYIFAKVKDIYENIFH